MLYERWRKIASAFQNEVALRDLPSRKQWTFAELAALAEQGRPKEGRFVCPQGGSPEFVFEVLAGWRHNKVVCPLEPGQAAPRLSAELPDEILHLKTTSASTSAPKMVAFTASQLCADAENIVSTMGLRREWPNLAAISLAHSYGFSNLVLPLLLHGIPLILVGSALPESIREAAKAENAVTLAAVPALWRTWQAADAIPSNVSLAISAGAPLPVTLEQEIFAHRGLKVHNFYGSSECGGIAYDATSAPRLDNSYAGAPMNNVQVSVGDDGCLQVRGAAVGKTYWPTPAANLADGVFRTSDLAEISFGSVYLRGRATDQINVAGRKVSPEEIERVLVSHLEVRECLVFGVPSNEAERSESIVACVVTTEKLAPESLRQHLLSRIPAWQVPREWWFVESFGNHPRGKTSRAVWREKFLKNKSAGVR